jgi:hypothetical protein
VIGASAGAAATVLLCAAAGLIVCRRRRLFDDDDDESEHAKQLSLSAGNPSQQLRTTDENLKRIMLGSHASRFARTPILGTLILLQRAHCLSYGMIHRVGAALAGLWQHVVHQLHISFRL